MNAAEIESMLASHPFLRGMRPAHLSALADCAAIITVSSGSYLGREPEPADVFYLVVSGKVGIETHAARQAPLLVQTVGPGEVVGWSWLVPPHRWQFDARVAADLRAIAIRGDCLRAKCGRDHELGYEILRRLVGVVASRLTAARMQLLDVYR